LACGDQRRLTGNGSALEVVLHDDALYKSTYFNHSSLYDYQNIGEIPTGSPPAETLNTGGVKNLRFSTNKSLYLANDTI